MVRMIERQVDIRLAALLRFGIYRKVTVLQAWMTCNVFNHVASHRVCSRRTRGRFMKVADSDPDHVTVGAELTQLAYSNLMADN